MGGTAGVGQVAQAVVGVGGTVMSSMAARSQQQYMNKLMSQGAGLRARQQGVDKFFLGGGKASELDVPGFADQFTSIDYALEQQLAQIDNQARDAQQQITENIPSGGAKLRALAELAQSAQDQKSQAVRQAQATKRDLDVKLTNQYTQQAMGRSYGPSQDARLWSAQQDYQNRVGDIKAMSQSLGSLAGRVFDPETSQPVEYIPPAAQPVGSQELLARTSTNDPYKQAGTWDWTEQEQ